MQYLFLNGRHIRDRSLQHALGEAYRGLLMTGRYPIAFLSLEMPPEMVDVNVHPTKLEVRFQDSGRLYSQLLATLAAEVSRPRDLTAHVQTAPAEPTPTRRPRRRPRPPQLRQQLVDWAKGKIASWQPRAAAAAAWPPRAQRRSTRRPQPPVRPAGSRLELQSLRSRLAVAAVGIRASDRRRCRRRAEPAAAVAPPRAAGPASPQSLPGRPKAARA